MEPGSPIAASREEALPWPAAASARPQQAVLAHSAFWLMTVLALGAFAATIPVRYGQLLEVAARNEAALQTVGVTAGFMASYITALDLVVVILYTLTAAVIFWRRADDWSALFVALTMVLLGPMITRPGEAVLEADVALRLPIVLVFALATVSVITFLYVFPDGRFVPRWTRWLALAWVVGVPAWYLLPALAATGLPWPPRVVPIPLVVLGLATGLCAQIYRYRAVSTPTQRQQTKWVVLGLAVAIQGVLWFLVLVPLLVPQVVEPGEARAAYVLLGVPIFYGATVLLPVSIGLSILRYRLWSIDVLINRALVYGLLTGLLALVYFGSVLMLQSGFRRLTGQESELAIIISTLASVALFQPLRSQLQAFIDRRFYRSKYDAARALATFSVRLRDEVDLDRLSAELVQMVDETVQPSSATLWLRQPAPERE